MPSEKKGFFGGEWRTVKKVADKNAAKAKEIKSKTLDKSRYKSDIISDSVTGPNSKAIKTLNKYKDADWYLSKDDQIKYGIVHSVISDISEYCANLDTIKKSLI